MCFVLGDYPIEGRGAAEIASSVERAVSGGALEPGQSLPPMRELAVQLGVNPNTVAAAYRTLRERGVIDRVVAEVIRPLRRLEPRAQLVDVGGFYEMVIETRRGRTLAIFVLPRFRDFFGSLDATLPLPTRIMIGAGDFFCTATAVVGGQALVPDGPGPIVRESVTTDEAQIGAEGSTDPAMSSAVTA